MQNDYYKKRNLLYYLFIYICLIYFNLFFYFSVKRNSKKVENDDPKEQWDKRKSTQLTKSEKLLLERFKSAVDRRKNISVTSQKQIAHEICLNSKTEIGFNQSMISKMYNGTHLPKCNYTIDAITSWIMKEEKK